MEPARMLEDAAAAAATATEPEAAERLALLVQASRLALGLDDDVTAFARASVTVRFDALLHAASGGRPRARELLADIARQTVVELADRGHDKVVALALWAGVSADASGLTALSEAAQGLAVARALRSGLPSALDDATRWVCQLVSEGPARDAALTALLDARLPADVADLGRWMPAVVRISDPIEQLRALLSLASRAAAGGAGTAALVNTALAAFEQAEGAWRGEAPALLGGIAVLQELAGASAWVAEAWAALDQVVEPQARAAACTTLLRAESQHGLTAWQQAFATVSRDGLIRARSKRWAVVMRDAAAAARWCRGGVAARVAAMEQVAAQLERVRVPERQAEAYALLADGLAVTGGAVEDALAGVRTGLQQTQDPWVRLALLPAIAAHCGRADAEAAADMVRLTRTPREAVAWLIGVAESL